MMAVYYINLIKEAFIDPRQSAQRILDTQTLDDKNTLLLMVTSYVVGMCLAQLTLFALDSQTASLPSMQVHIPGLILTALTSILMASLILGVGRYFGGTGEFRDILKVVLWQFFLTSFLTPLETWAQLELPVAPEPGTTLNVAEISSLVIGVYTFVFGAQLYLLANFIAQAHGFASTRKVALALIGISLFVATLLALSISG